MRFTQKPNSLGDSNAAKASRTPMRDWYVIAEKPAPAPHLAHPEGCAALCIVLVTVPHASRSCEHFPCGFDLHLPWPHPTEPSFRACSSTPPSKDLRLLFNVIIGARIHPPTTSKVAAHLTCIISPPWSRKSGRGAAGPRRATARASAASAERDQIAFSAL